VESVAAGKMQQTADSGREGWKKERRGQKPEAKGKDRGSNDREPASNTPGPLLTLL